MRINDLKKPLQIVTLGIAILSSIVPIVGWMAYLWSFLFKEDFSIGREIYFVIVLTIVSIIFFVIFLLVRKTQRFGIYASIGVLVVFIVYLFYAKFRLFLF